LQSCGALYKSPGESRGKAGSLESETALPHRSGAATGKATDASASVLYRFRALQPLHLVQEQNLLGLVLLDALPADLAGLAYSGLDPEAGQQPSVQHNPGGDDKHDP